MGLELEKNNDFEKQFENHKTLHILGADVDVTHIRPPRLKSETPIVVAEAFAHTKNVYKYAVREFYNRGRSVVIYDQPREGGNYVLPQEEQDVVQEFLDTCPEEVRAALILLESARQQSLKKINVLAHSRGFAYAAIAALLDDRRTEIEARNNGTEKRENIIKSIVAYGGIGLIGEDNTSSLGWRAFKQNFVRPKWPKISKKIQEEISTPEISERRRRAEEKGMFEYGEPDEKGRNVEREVGSLIQSRGIKYLWASLTRAYAEVRGLTSIQLHTVLPKLRRMGIDISIMRASEDTVFPQERSDAVAKEFAAFGINNLTLAGEHSSLALDPRVAKIAENEFARLEAVPKTLPSSGGPTEGQQPIRRFKPPSPL